MMLVERRGDFAICRQAGQVGKIGIEGDVLPPFLFAGELQALLIHPLFPQGGILLDVVEHPIDDVDHPVVRVPGAADTHPHIRFHTVRLHLVMSGRDGLDGVALLQQRVIEEHPKPREVLAPVFGIAVGGRDAHRLGREGRVDVEPQDQACLELAPVLGDGGGHLGCDNHLFVESLEVVERLVLLLEVPVEAVPLLVLVQTHRILSLDAASNHLLEIKKPKHEVLGQHPTHKVLQPPRHTQHIQIGALERLGQLAEPAASRGRQRHLLRQAAEVKDVGTSLSFCISHHGHGGLPRPCPVGITGRRAPAVVLEVALQRVIVGVALIGRAIDFLIQIISEQLADLIVLRLLRIVDTRVLTAALLLQR
mmetsp:Transcript_19198/g.46309  ORF Transcript_19198/g.46309 Transcript_19198/m.46309 type:complete len:365 (-) Transcript_19198:135-1229(-)